MELGTNINELELSTRVYNALRAAGIKTIGQLISRAPSDLLRLQNFGQHSLAEVKEVLTQHGFSLSKVSIPSPRSGISLGERELRELLHMHLKTLMGSQLEPAQIIATLERCLMLATEMAIAERTFSELF